MNSVRAFACVVILATATHALAENPQAKAHYDKGAALYEKGEIDAALVELEAANQLEVTAKGCYTLGQALRKKGDCRRAIEQFKCAYDRAPDEKFRDAANFQISRCVREGNVDLAPKPSVVYVPAPTPTQPLELAPPWYRDTAGGVLLGLGVVASGVGGGLLVHAESRASGIDDLQGFRDAQGAGTERMAGAVSLSVGGALLVGSIVRYVIVARR